ncbi:2-hydroxychromene-2-carboxylate isomerase [Tsuneonella dongtanensis]|uniref:2-hydroxychromene-2-carboxylate isomerase n=1 Tax=Tsuneonella dongtanensis TaxID=692370 RepID=A0A1B2ACF5_9SPHN|nr:2-hydroxychromene-2-carboxylate isomerase [Tsuneonella dongtanensis]ANY19778.1 2-hydroxychromene-2-carboxylate isomerase [Tsuneonella dongtanensis]
MPAKTLEFIFDLVSPNAYLAWWPMKDMLARTGATLEITPVLLGGMHKLTGNAPPMIRDADVKGKVEYGFLEMRRFVAKHGLDRFALPQPFPFPTMTLQRMLLAVEGAERIALAEHLLVAIFERGLDVTDPAALGADLAAGGFDAAALAEAAQDPAIKQRLADNTAAAVERGAFGIPTWFVGSEMFFGKERLGQIEDELAG